MHNKIIYLGERPIAENHAGSKARLDVDSILFKRYAAPFMNMSLDMFKSSLSKAKYLSSFDSIKYMYKLLGLKNKNIVIQYPYLYNSILKYIFSSVLNHNKIIMIIHDIDMLRDISVKDSNRTIEDLNKCMLLIVHNSSMINKLREIGVYTKMIELEVFDYLLEKNPKVYRKLGREVVFAGNLQKSRFLETIGMEKLKLVFNLYGPGFDKNLIKWRNVEYKGSYPPDIIPFQVQGSFGLIWDGTSINSCDGSYGHYMKFNNPHKLSLYIAAGLPVIVWKEAAIAKFVEKENIGFCVNNLEEISTIIDLMDEEKYNTFVNNLVPLQNKLCNGYFLNRALDKAENILGLELSNNHQ